MNLVLDVIRTVLNQPAQFIAQRTHLDLPGCTQNFPFSHQQKQAVELALSNAPVVAIAGTPGSGKTEIALAALETAIQHQRSTLVVSSYASVFTAYQHLSLPPIVLADGGNHHKKIKDWIQQELDQPKINFLPLFWLEDQLFEQLQTQHNPGYWLNLLYADNPSKDEQLSKAIAKTLPDLQPQRQQLLVHRLKQSVTLLEHREWLYQNYKNLSDTSINQIVNAALPYIKAPILCLSDHLKLLKSYTFDLVIVENSQDLQAPTLKTIAQFAKKLVLLGELKSENSLFSRLFKNLSPAYRLRITENHRLHPDLAYKIFPNLFELEPMPYTPFKSKYKPLPAGSHRLIWLDIKVNDQILLELQESIDRSGYEPQAKAILVFTDELADRLKQGLPKFSDVVIDSVHNWRGRECEALWIICDTSEQSKPHVKDWPFVLTRASQRITILGDWDYYKESLGDLEAQFHFVRDIVIPED